MLEKVLKLVSILFFILVAGCTKRADTPGSILSSDLKGPFHYGTSIASENSKILIEHAMIDYNLALSGKTPLYAKLKNMLTDGGTENFQGDGYSLTILCSLVNIGGIDGYFFGPIITFDSDKVVGNSKTISHVEFFSKNELKKIKGK